VVPACNPSTWDAKAEGLRIAGLPGLNSEFEVSLHYIAICHLKNKIVKGMKLK
jgi:hypothetical protein